MSLTAKLALSPLLVLQALATRARLPRLPEADGARFGVVGEGPVLRLLVAGDSSAAGVGVQRQRDALAAPLAQRLAVLARARIDWQLVAQSGLTTAQLHQRLARESFGPIDVAVIVSGVNDVVGQVPTRHAIAAREALANWLRNACGVQHVAFAPLPPVHLFPGLPQPLRWVAGRDAMRHNTALDEWVATRSDVSRVAMDLPLQPRLMARDGFHPGAPVYQYCATAIATHLASDVRPLLQLESFQQDELP